MVARAFFEQLASAICCRFCDLVPVHSDTLHVKKLLHALDEIDVKLLLELGFGFGFNAVYKVTDVPWVVVEIAQMFVNNQTAPKSKEKAKGREAVACGAASSQRAAACACAGTCAHVTTQLHEQVGTAFSHEDGAEAVVIQQRSALSWGGWTASVATMWDPPVDPYDHGFVTPFFV